MAFRKRRRPTPWMGIPPPYQPITGEHATLHEAGIFPYCAMMQVSEADTYSDYVVCRGVDTRTRKFAEDISVAKQFGNRVAGCYLIGETYPALLPTQGTPTYTPPIPTDVNWRVGQNPGTASPAGHPDDLDDSITGLTDHNGQSVNWILVDSGPSWRLAKLDATLNQGSSASATIWKDESTVTSPAVQVTVYDWMMKSSESIASGKKIVIQPIAPKWYVVAAECP